MRLVFIILFFHMLASRIQRARALTSYSLRRFHRYQAISPSSFKFLTPSSYAWFTAGLVMIGGGTSVALSQEGDDKVIVPPFEQSVLAYDHYNGVTLHLDKLEDNHASDLFAEKLKQALNFWKAEGRKGIWIHAPTDRAHLLPHCIDQGFSFNFVREKTLILSQWLPENKPSKLPLGPSHQVGIGALVLHPSDPSQMLVVQEKSGPGTFRMR
jgi:hypothetical protein